MNAPDRPRRLPTLRQRAARRSALALFRFAMPHRRWVPPAGTRELTATAADGTSLRGWFAAPEDALGTVLIVHGLTRNCTMDGIPWWGERFREHGWASAAIDLRGHGRSGNALPTFGPAEGMDISSALDACARAGLPRPWVVMGGSLGALSAQCAALVDERIDGVALLAMPGSPWHGVRRGGRAFSELAASELGHLPRPFAALAGLGLAIGGRLARVVARLIDVAHGADILASGDVRKRRLPRRRPAVLSVVGDRDVYDWRMTALAWSPWRVADGARPFRTPAQAPAQRAWFVLARGVGHPPAQPHLLEWPGLLGLLREFLDAVRARAHAG